MPRVAKPAALHLVRGTWRGKGRAKHEPVAQGRLFEPPEHFSETQKAIWTYAIEHAPLSLLRKIDLDLLASWCTAVALQREALQKLAGAPLVVRSPAGGFVPNPFLTVLNKQALIMIRAASELGFTPTGRARIAIGYERQSKEGGKEVTDPASEFFAA